MAVWTFPALHALFLLHPQRTKVIQMQSGAHDFGRHAHLNSKVRNQVGMEIGHSPDPSPVRRTNWLQILLLLLLLLLSLLLLLLC